MTRIFFHHLTSLHGLWGSLHPDCRPRYIRTVGLATCVLYPVQSLFLYPLPPPFDRPSVTRLIGIMQTVRRSHFRPRYQCRLKVAGGHGPYIYMGPSKPLSRPVPLSLVSFPLPPSFDRPSVTRLIGIMQTVRPSHFIRLCVV